MTPEQLDTLALGLAGGVVGLAIGSFLTVVVARVPAGESLAPRSACPKCGARIGAKDNIPLVSWLALKGRGRCCGQPISGLYPLIELTTCLLFALVAMFVRPVAAVPAYLYAAAIAVALTVIDLRTRRLPDAIVYPSYPALAGLLALASWVSGDWVALQRGAIGGLGLLAGYGLLVILVPHGMGRGDAKLAGLVGLALAYQGWGVFAVGALAAFFLGAVWGVGVMVKSKEGRRATIPFGPWMCAGAALGLAVGAPLWDVYTGLMAF
ncbi:MAG: prepilin peptidase [Bifidobacteriaceae bacterium]|nr:prepilin peptidase [Bifidobacteriaceae bacterium]